LPEVTVSDVRLYYEERGTGTAIVGIHGAGSSAVFWEDAAVRLSELGRAIVYDRRGCSRSERPDPYETTSVAVHADDALGLMRALDAEPAILIGRSYGGTTALDFALRHPESVLGVALLEAGPMGLSHEYDEWFATLRERLEALAATGRIDAVGEAVIREVFGAWEELPRSFRDVFTANGQALLAEIRGGERLTNAAELATLEVPTLILAAEDSPEVFQRENEALEQALPQARAIRVGGDHAIDPAHPEVLRFVRELLGR
jgi:pimeloyl-ACP methyl ester carboxylesterase